MTVLSPYLFTRPSRVPRIHATRLIQINAAAARRLGYRVVVPQITPRQAFPQRIPAYHGAPDA